MARKHAGFTIVELMIATAVVGVLLTIVAVVLTGIGRLYSKGISQSSIQGATRSVLDDVSQQVMLNSTVNSGTLGVNSAYCIGTVRYSFIRGVELSSTQHVLWRDKAPTAGCTPVDLTATPPSSDKAATEMVPARGRLAAFRIVETTINGNKAYILTVRITLGANDQLCSETAVPGSCTSSATMSGPGVFVKDDLRCKQSAGSQYCAVSHLETLVQTRL